MREFQRLSRDDDQLERKRRFLIDNRRDGAFRVAADALDRHDHRRFQRNGKLKIEN
ncbi:MAG: hypothetical protein ACTHQM_18175 [Thermoanaerobaculia bacterium]